MVSQLHSQLPAATVETEPALLTIICSSVMWNFVLQSCRNNTSDYYINKKKVNVKEVTTLLKEKGIDLDNNRFLILQVSCLEVLQLHIEDNTCCSSSKSSYMLGIIPTLCARTHWRPVPSKEAAHLDPSQQVYQPGHAWSLIHVESHIGAARCCVCCFLVLQGGVEYINSPAHTALRMNDACLLLHVTCMLLCLPMYCMYRVRLNRSV